MKRLATLFATLSLTTTSLAQWSPQFTFGETYLQSPIDVAVYEPCGSPGYVFVTDASPQALLRFDGIGDGTSAPKTYSVPDPRGVAINDIPGHVNFGQVYVASTSTIEVMTLGGVNLMCLALDGSGFGDPKGVAVDDDGNVYVADEGNNEVYKFASSHFEPPHSLCKVASPAGVYLPTLLTGLSGPRDVSVDIQGRLHVAYCTGRVAIFANDGSEWSNLSLPTPNVGGIDARDPGANTWYSNGGVSIRRSWNQLTGALLGGAQTTPGPLSQGGGLEYAHVRYQNSPCKPITGEELLFVVEKGTAFPHVGVFGSTTQSPAIGWGWSAWWRFEEDTGSTASEVFKLNDGTWSSSPAPAAERGMVGCALSFDSGNADVSVPDHQKLDFGTGSFTIEFWLRAQPGHSNHTLLDKRDGGTGRGWAVALINGHFGLVLDDDVSSYENFYPQVPENYVADGVWHHVAAVVDRQGPSSTQLYVDGAPISVVDTTPRKGNLSNGKPLVFGRNTLSSSANLRGSLDEVTLYKRALSAWAISRIYGAGSAGKHVRCRSRFSITSSGTSSRTSTSGQL